MNVAKHGNQRKKNQIWLKLSGARIASTHIKPMTAIVNTAICLRMMMGILLNAIVPVIGSVQTENARVGEANGHGENY